MMHTSQGSTASSNTYTGSANVAQAGPYQRHQPAVHQQEFQQQQLPHSQHSYQHLRPQQQQQQQQQQQYLPHQPQHHQQQQQQYHQQQQQLHQQHPSQHQLQHQSESSQYQPQPYQQPQYQVQQQQQPQNPVFQRHQETPAVGSSASVTVLVMNLPYRVRWQDLKDLCRQACPVERADVALELDGRSRGFGEVICRSRQDADRLFAMFDGCQWQNRRLSVIVMDEQRLQQQQQQQQQQHALTPSLAVEGHADYPPGSGFGGPSRPQEFRVPSAVLQPQVPTDEKLIFVGNLPFSMQWQDLKDLLRPAGRIQRTDVSMADDGRSRGWGTALFVTAEEARKAVEMFNETEVEGRVIKVRLDRLGGRGVPANRQAGPRYFDTGAGSGFQYNANSPQHSHASPYSDMDAIMMQQQHPGSYPLQQNYANPSLGYASTGLEQAFAMSHISRADHGQYGSSQVKAYGDNGPSDPFAASFTPKTFPRDQLQIAATRSGVFDTRVTSTQQRLSTMPAQVERGASQQHPQHHDFGTYAAREALTPRQLQQERPREQHGQHSEQQSTGQQQQEQQRQVDLADVDFLPPTGRAPEADTN